MSAQFVVNIDDAVLKKAQNFANKNGVDLEGSMVNYLKLLAAQDDNGNYSLTIIARALKGVVHSQIDLGQIFNKELEKNHQQ